MGDFIEGYLEENRKANYLLMVGLCEFHTEIQIMFSVTVGKSLHSYKLSFP